MKRLLVAALLLVVCVAAAAQQVVVPVPITVEQTISSEMPQDRSTAPAEDTPNDQPSFMKWLTNHGYHNMSDEKWNAYGQFTFIWGGKASFPAPYTNLNGSPNSLLPRAEDSFTGTATFYVGASPWRGGEVYFVPEILSERPLSQLKGLGAAIQDFELQKGGGTKPTIYVSRAYLRQTFGLGGKPVVKESGQQQLGTTYTSRRLVFIAGNFSL